jgi:hypothetical protein
MAVEDIFKAWMRDDVGGWAEAVESDRTDSAPACLALELAIKHGIVEVAEAYHNKQPSLFEPTIGSRTPLLHTVHPFNLQI